jgi:uncharacterized membrane protein YhaH (DUF805 family)
MRALSFEGRAGIGEFWRIHVGVFLAAFLSGAIARKAPVLAAGLTALYVYVGTAVSVRRLHDRGMSGWFVLVGWMPLVGCIWWLIFLGLAAGNRGSNRYGLPDS